MRGRKNGRKKRDKERRGRKVRGYAWSSQY
jgi:hypothetical protein